MLAENNKQSSNNIVYINCVLQVVLAIRLYFISIKVQPSTSMCMPNGMQIAI